MTAIDRDHIPGVLHTDLYELTMAQAYWHAGIVDTDACFHMSFRTNPFDGGFAIACGLGPALEYLESFAFSDDQIEYLADVPGADGMPVFVPDFLEWLRELRFACDVDAVPEGTVVFAGEPLVRVAGPVVQAQVVETALLNAVNFQTLVATKAARVCLAAGGTPVVEFGLRRAQGPDGGLSASRAAYVGGCVGTSNVRAGQRFGIPIAGTHAHSWVMAFDDELASFEAYAEAMPNNCTFLVDTYDTLQGVRNAVEVGRALRARGHELVGIRIDSGDLAWLSVRARKILDDGGFADAKIIASSELDENLIVALKDQGAAIDMWGVGTRLATCWDQPALGGVYKLSAIRRPGEDWTPRIKVSEETAKVTTPGLLGVRRYVEDGQFVGDMIHDTGVTLTGDVTMIDPADQTRRKTFSESDSYFELLEPAFRDGKRVCPCPSLPDVRARAAEQMAALDPSILRFVRPRVYRVGLESGVFELRNELVLQARRPRSPSDLPDVGRQIPRDIRSKE